MVELENFKNTGGSFVAIDIETTGLSPIACKIIEIAAVRFYRGKPTKVFQTLINPGVNIPFKITQLTGINDEMLIDAPAIDDITNLDSDLSSIKSRSYDLILNGQEIASGSIRIHSQALQEKIFEIIGMPKEEAKERFSFLLRAFDYGAPPHGGIAFGLDRLYSIVTNSESIREVIAFPKTQKGVCSLTSAPSKVDSSQLKELYLELIEKEEKE